MAKLTKQESKLHLKALDLIHSDKVLTMSDKLFVLENYQESSGNTNSLAGAFFTPWGLACDTMLEVLDGEIIVDLCSGIGCLTLAALNNKIPQALISVELNPEYYEIGKRLSPESYWINGDVFDVLNDELSGLSGVSVISNPPFGQIGTGKSYKGDYTGGEFEFKLISAAKKIASHGTFILPQGSTPFKYSGSQYFQNVTSNKYDKFAKQTGLEFEFNCGISTEQYLKQWHGVSPLCEIVTVGY